MHNKSSYEKIHRCIRREEEVIKVAGKMSAGFFMKKNISDLRKSQKTHTALMHSAAIYTEHILRPVTKEGGPLTVETKKKPVAVFILLCPFSLETH